MTLPVEEVTPKRGCVLPWCRGHLYLFNEIAIKVTAGRVWGLVGEGAVAGEDTKMTALAERRASCLFSLPSPQVRLASLRSEA